MPWLCLTLVVGLLGGCSAPRLGQQPQIRTLVIPVEDAHDRAVPPTAVRALIRTNAADLVIRVGAWNIEHLGSSDKRSGVARGVEQSAEALADYIEFSRVDVLGLVEIYGNASGGSKNRILDRTFATLNADGDANWKYLLFDRGNRQLTGIAWNEKVVRQVGPVHRVTFGPGAPTFGPAGNRIWDRHPHVVKFSYARQTNMTDFAVIVLHMKADYRGDFSEHREVEAKLLARALPVIRQRVDQDLVLIGDANCKNHQEDAVQAYERARLRDLNRTDAATHWQYGPLDRAFVPEDQPEFAGAALTVNRQNYLHDQHIQEVDFKRNYSDHFMIVLPVKVMADDDP